jgi:hypothetical protein
VAQSKKEDPAMVCQAFEIIFCLLSKIDEGTDDILFFADEGGSWQIGVHWENVLPAWFRVLSATAGPSEYARRITTFIAASSARREGYVFPPCLLGCGR